MEQHSTGERKAVRMCVGLCVVMSECIEMCDVNTAEEKTREMKLCVALSLHVLPSWPKFI